MIRALVFRRVPYAILLALAVLFGTVLGGAAFQVANPAFARIVWLEHEAAAETGDIVVRRALFADGRFLTLTPDGYAAGILDPAITAEIFATVRAGANTWRAAYVGRGIVGERIELALEGTHTARVEITNPGMNFGIPADLARVLRLLAAADRTSASVPFAPTSLRLWASLEGPVNGAPIEGVPPNFPFAKAQGSGGIVVGGAELLALKSVWQDLDQRFDPGVAHRLISVDGQTWRISWQLDLDAIGSLQVVEGS